MPEPPATEDSDPPAGGGSSAVILPVADAERLVSGWRLRHNASAGTGIPAHVTILAPFLPPDHLTPEVIADLRALCAEWPVPTLRFERTARFPPTGDADGVLYLAPEPADRLRAFTEALVARWPEAPPYGGLHATIVPHLTIAIADEATLDALEAEVRAALRAGFSAAPSEVLLCVSDGERWSPFTAMPCGPGR